VDEITNKNVKLKKMVGLAITKMVVLFVVLFYKWVL